MKLAVQTLLLPGSDLGAKFANAARFGFDGVEVAVGSSFDLVERFDEVQRASESSGIPVCAICTHPMHDPFDADPHVRARRFERLTDIMRAASALGARGVVSVPFRTPSAFPEPTWPALADEVADAYGSWAADLPQEITAVVFLEPLNRYEAGFLTTLARATELCERIDNPRVQLLADLFHMNIEEASMDGAITGARRWLGHVHIADNNRFEPGAGCLNLAPVIRALSDIQFDGYLSIECWSPRGPELSGDPEVVLPCSVAFMRQVIASNDADAPATAGVKGGGPDERHR